MCSHVEHCFLQRTQMKTAATWVVGLVTTAGYHMHTHPWIFWYWLSSLLPWFMTVRRDLLCTLDNAATAQVYSHWIGLKSWTMWFLSLVCFCSLFWPESLYLVPELNKQREKKKPRSIPRTSWVDRIFISYEWSFGFNDSIMQNWMWWCILALGR